MGYKGGSFTLLQLHCIGLGCGGTERNFGFGEREKKQRKILCLGEGRSNLQVHFQQSLFWKFEKIIFWQVRMNEATRSKTCGFFKNLKRSSFQSPFRKSARFAKVIMGGYMENFGRLWMHIGSWG